MGASIILNPNTVRDTSKYYNPRVIQDRHREIARRLVAGQTHTQIGQDMGLAHCTISNIVNSPLIRAMINELHDERDKEATNISKRIRLLAQEAMTQYETILVDEATSKNLKVKIASDVLDRAGYQPVNVHVSEHINADAMKAIKERAFNAGILEVMPEPDMQDSESSISFPPDPLEAPTFFDLEGFEQNGTD